MTISKSPEKFNLEDLINKFNDPLKPYSAHEVESTQEAKEEFEKLTAKFKLQSDTKVQEQALQHILELLKGKIQFYPGGDLKSFAPFIASNISDMRPSLVRMASLVVSAEALVLEDDFIPSVEIIFPPLLKQLASSNQSIVHSCHLALLNIAKHCMNRKVANLFLSNSSSPISANRQIAAECAHIITETWPSQIASLLSKELNNAVSTLLQDKVDTIKDIALSATKINRSPDQSSKSSKLVSTLQYIPTPPASKPKSKKKLISPKYPQKRSVSPSQKTGETTSDFMYITNPSQARSFKMYLDKIVENKNFSSLDQFKGTLVGSVLFAIKEIPNYNEWEAVIESLFDNYENIFMPHLIEIMAQFGFQDDIFDFANNKVGIQNLAESIVAEGKSPPTDSFNFFVAVFKSNRYQIDITKPIFSLLQHLIKNNLQNKNVEYIRKVVQSQPDKEIKSILQKILFNLSNNEDNGYNEWKEELEKLSLNFFQPNSNQYLRNSVDPSSNSPLAKTEITSSSKLTTFYFDQNLPDLIQHGTEEQKVACLNFITTASAKLRNVSFASSLKPIINALIETENSLSASSADNDSRPTCSWHKNAIKCIASMMVDMDCLSESLIMVGGQNEQITEIVLESLYQFTVSAMPQKIFAYHKVLVKKLIVFMNNDNLNIRHSTISIFAECRKKIPKEFLYQMKRNFTPAQIRLIEIKVGRNVKK